MSLCSNFPILPGLNSEFFWFFKWISVLHKKQSRIGVSFEFNEIYIYSHTFAYSLDSPICKLQRFDVDANAGKSKVDLLESLAHWKFVIDVLLDFAQEIDVEYWHDKFTIWLLSGRDTGLIRWTTNKDRPLELF